VGYWLRMSGEIHDWLTDLRGDDPKMARLVGQALIALMSEGASLGPPLLVPVDSPRPEELTEAIELAYQDRLERVSVARRRAADATILVMDIRNAIAQLESAQVKLDDQRRRAQEEGGPDEAAQAAERLAAAQRKTAEARQLLPRALEVKRQLTERQQRLQARTDAFRARKEVLKATYTAARTDLLVDEAMAAAGQDGNDDDGQQHDPDQAAAALRDVTAEIERELRLAPWPEGLMELRPGAPGDSQVRILFAVEPPGTALLISVLEGREAILDHYREAIMLSADVLRQVRAGQAPEAAVRGYDDTRSFLDELYPGDADQATVAAAALVERSRGRTLAQQRIQLGLTQAEVAQRMGVPPERVSALEHAEADATEVRTLAAYVAALGGRLEITAEFGAERVQLR
jgi:DNA-binding XRE family transcriptional regulator